MQKFKNAEADSDYEIFNGLSNGNTSYKVNHKIVRIKTLKKSTHSQNFFENAF